MAFAASRKGRIRNQIWRGARIFLASSMLLAPGIGAANAQADGQSLGFVMTNWHIGMNGLGADAPPTDCPDGFQLGNRDNWRAQFSTKTQQDEQLRKYGYVSRLGPNGEDSWIYPDRVKDVVPFREVQSKTAVGINLDQTKSGEATAKTCGHTKFANGVDNQLYRVVGCHKGYRKTGVADSHFSDDLQHDAHARVLLEVTGIQDLQNDDSVDVSIYVGMDTSVEYGVDGKVVPTQIQRVNENLPDLISHLHGRIEKGVLRTEPSDVRLPVWQDRIPGEVDMRGMRLEVALSDKALKGLVVGYEDLDNFWINNRKHGIVTGETQDIDPPNLYKALHKYADGNKDPATGMCTSISAAFEIEAYRVVVLHPNRERRSAANDRQ